MSDPGEPNFQGEEPDNGMRRVTPDEDQLRFEQTSVPKGPDGLPAPVSGAGDGVGENGAVGNLRGSASRVTREGVRDSVPQREAVPHGGARREGGRRDPGRRDPGRRRGGRGRGERLMVPDADFTSYYGKPILQPPVWEARSIASYLFLGGLAGASSVLAAGAQATGRAHLARNAKVGALGAIGLSVVALVEDLGRPERFPMMLRVAKPTSPMSVGSWILSAYGPAAGLAALTAVSGRLPRVGALATGAAALTGPAVASYTAVLVADTAVPAWHEGFQQLPFVFTGSAAAAAGGFGMLTSPVGECAPARRAAIVGGSVELAANAVRERRMGLAAEAGETGRAGLLRRLAQGFTAAGIVGSATVARRSRLGAALSGAAMLAGSACTRFSIFEAGRVSTVDPKYVVQPQRERLAARDDAGRRPARTTL